MWRPAGRPISEQEQEVMSLETEYKLYSEEEEMPESNLQLMLMFYLISVLKYWYAEQGWFVGGNLLIIPPKETAQARKFTSLCPDIMVCIGTVLTEAEQQALSSWNMNEPNRPAPTVVFEISSEATWTVDLEWKSVWYGQLGVREYFAFDPQQLWRGSTVQLRGWRYVKGQAVELELDKRGRLWSAELDSYLVPDGVRLRLTDRRGRQRLNKEEAAELAQRQSDLARRKAEQQARAEQRARQAEQQARLLLEQQLEAERLAKEAALAAQRAAQREIEELRGKLRQATERPPE
jgi:Uma2 family endonuclease